jgi:hypothetical protein
MAMKHKAPIGVYILAGVYLLSPIGDILLSIRALGEPKWYEMGVALPFLPSITFANWLWLLSIFIAGIFLVLRHKWSWILAILILPISILFNYFNSRAYGNFSSLSTAGFLSCITAAIVISYFRYPYLDRREKWWTFHQRFNVDFAAQITLDAETVLHTDSITSEKFVLGRVKNLSPSGAYIELPAELAAQFQRTDPVRCHFPEELNLSAIIKHISASGIGVEFTSVSVEQKEAIALLCEAKSV